MDMNTFRLLMFYSFENETFGILKLGLYYPSYLIIPVYFKKVRVRRNLSC